MPPTKILGQKTVLNENTQRVCRIRRQAQHLIMGNFLAQANPTKQPGTVEDIGNLCVFLASSYITGQELVIDGGGTILEKSICT